MLPWKWILWKIGKLYPLFFLAFFKELSGDFLLVHDTKGHLILVNVQSASKVAGFNIYFNGSMIYRCDWLSGYTGNNSLQELSYAPPRYRDKVKLSVGQVDFDKKFMLHSLTWKTPKNSKILSDKQRNISAYMKPCCNGHLNVGHKI